MLEAWSDLFSDSATVRTMVTFGHVAGILLGGGCAVAADVVILTRRADDRTRSLATLGAHRFVLIGLAVTIVSGLLLLLANTSVYLPSAIFWIKIALVVALSANGRRVTTAAARSLAGDPSDRSRLRRAAGLSLTLWFVVVLLGAALPNL